MLLQKLQTGRVLRGQAIIELLAANAFGNCPVLLDLTDGNLHYLYTVRDQQLVVWSELSPTQVGGKKDSVPSRGAGYGSSALRRGGGVA